MEEKNLVTNVYWSDNERFADLTNVVFSPGRVVLRGSDLKSVDGFTGTFVGKLRQRFAVYRYRDVIKKAAFGSNFVMIGVENQSDIHYGMPVRVMGYDYLGYDEQMKKLKKWHRKKRDLKGAEYLSGMAKTDKLMPICPMVLYYGEEPWDGPENLLDMMDWENIPEEFRREAADYPIKVIDMRRFEDSENLKTDARVLLGFLKRQNNPKELKKYVEENTEEFSNIDEDAYDMISVLGNAPELVEEKAEFLNEEGGMNMCKAFEVWIEESRNEGLLAGRSEGLLIGRNEGLLAGRSEGLLEGKSIFVRNLLKRGMSDEDICGLAECEQALVDEVRRTL